MTRLLFASVAALSVGAVVACSEETTSDGSAPGGATSTGGFAMGGESSGSGGTSPGGAPGETGGTGGTVAGPELPPDTLSATGLYESDMETLANGVRPFAPAYTLWTDTAAKKRFVQLPEGAQIDTSDPNYWQYPAGTRLWKEFSRDDTRIETRLMEKREDGSWWMISYHWRDDQSDADAVPDGVENASGTAHDIPSTSQCQECHNRMPDKSLGFTAIQLSHTEEGLGDADHPEATLAALAAEGALTDDPGTLAVPGDATEREALGYLHANCGHCHNPRSSVFARVRMQLWLETDTLTSVGETTIFTTTVDQEQYVPSDGPPAATHLITSGDTSTSAIYLRMDDRGEYAMPPLGTEDVDETGRDAVGAWIASLEP